MWYFFIKWQFAFDQTSLTFRPEDYKYHNGYDNPSLNTLNINVLANVDIINSGIGLSPVRHH